MCLRITPILLLLQLSFTANAQFQAANWVCPNGWFKLKITSFGLQIDSFSISRGGSWANASISSPSGRLLAYSFGDDIQNSAGQIMENGCCLSHITCTQSNTHFQGCIILPKPGSSTKYYLFIKDNGVPPYCQPTRVTATLFDMSYNNGLGKVLERTVPILEDTLSDSRMTACRHANGRDWWLINHEYNTNRIYTHLITPDSIYGPYSQYIGGTASRMDWYGWSLFSQSGDIFVTTTLGMQHITILTFDRCTGAFSNYRTIPFDSINVSLFLSLSPNGQYLYSSNYENLYQYDLHAVDIAGSMVQLVGDTNPDIQITMMTLMPDGKIYQASWGGWGKDCISIIDSPNLKAPSCGYHFRTVCIQGGGLLNSVPNFPNYNLGPLVGSGCDTLAAIEPPEPIVKTIQLWPNPANQTLQIIMPQAGEYQMQLYNISGQLVKKQSIAQTETISTANFATGVYVIKVSDTKTGANFHALKFLVLH